MNKSLIMAIIVVNAIEGGLWGWHLAMLSQFLLQWRESSYESDRLFSLFVLCRRPKWAIRVGALDVAILERAWHSLLPILQDVLRYFLRALSMVWHLGFRYQVFTSLQHCIHLCQTKLINSESFCKCWTKQVKQAVHIGHHAHGVNSGLHLPAHIGMTWTRPQRHSLYTFPRTWLLPILECVFQLVLLLIEYLCQFVVVLDRTL